MRLLLLLLVLLTPVMSPAATYHVATGGSDSGTGASRCTRATNSSTPLLTINIAMACANPGDTVSIGPGTFSQRIDLNTAANGLGGTSGGGYLTLQGAIPLGPTVTNKAGSTRLTAGGTNIWMVYGRHVQWMKVKNLEISGTSGGGIGLFGTTTHVEVSDTYVHDNNATTSALSAIRATARYSLTTNTVQGAEFGSPTYITLARNHIKQWTTGFNETLPGSGTESMTVAGDLTHFLIEDNLVDAGQFIGIDMIGKSVAVWESLAPAHTLPIPPESWPKQGLVRGNTVKNMRVGFGAPDVGIYCDACREIVVERNRVEGGPGYCYAMSTEENGFLISQIVMRDNIGIACGTVILGTGPGINTSNPAIHGLSEHLRTVHNTALKTKANGPVWRFGWAPGAVGKNNILAVSASVNVPYQWTPADVSANPALNANLFWGSIEPDSWQYKGTTYFDFPAYKSGSLQEAQGLLANPLFTNVATGDLTLQAGSPALNAGVPVTTAATAGSGSVIRVQDAHYFIDGYDVVQGDVIQIGTTLANIAIVTAVNYTTGDLTLDRSMPAWSVGTGVTYPYLGSAPDLGACEGGLPGSRCTTAAPPPPPPLPPAVALELTHTCATASNVLNARVMGALFSLAPTATYEADALARSRCASSVSITDSASVLQHPFSLFPPWQFQGTAGPNTGNTCTNCLSVHGGTPSVNAAGSGYTLTTFREGGSVSTATGGVGALVALPGLCRQVVDGVVTPTPLWPWPMEARIAAARSLAGSGPVNVTAAVETALGAIPLVCQTPPPRPAGETTWFLALPAASPPGVDGGTCTIEAPCATLAHVGSRMASGDTVYLRGGTYAQALTPGMLPGGTSWSAPTTVAAWQTEVVVLQVSTGAVVELANAGTDRYLALTRLILDGASAAPTQGLVVSGGAGPIRFQSGEIRETGRERIVVDGGQGVEIVTSTITGGLTLPAVRVQGSTHAFVLQQVLVQTSPAHGVQIVGPHHTQARLTQNTIQGNTESGIVLDATGVLIDNNLVVENGLGIAVASQAAQGVLVNNTIADNTGAGVHIAELALETQLTNTLLWGNTPQLVDEGDATVLTTNLLTDPGFVGGGDYHMALGTSPAVDTGTTRTVGQVARDGTPRPQGLAWDIGAYEQAGVAEDPPPLTVSPRAARGLLDQQ